MKSPLPLPASVHLAFALRMLALVTLLMSAAANAAGFADGDKVRIRRAAPMFFGSEQFREGIEGELFKVLAYRTELKKVFVLAKGKDGRDIALGIDADAVELARAAVRSATGSSGTSDNQKAMAANIAAEVVRLRKNADVIDRPNPLIPNDTSNQARAAKLRAQADALERQAASSVSASPGRRDAIPSPSTGNAGLKELSLSVAKFRAEWEEDARILESHLNCPWNWRYLIILKTENLDTGPPWSSSTVDWEAVENFGSARNDKK